MNQKEKAQVFRELHHRAEILVLPNAWDAASARVFELAGAPAVATTSSGLAASLGYPDGEIIPRALVISAVQQICRTVEIPVSVDAEAGYGNSAEEVGETVKTLLDAGAVGVNLEDGMLDPRLLVAKIAAAREISAAKDVPLFVNARTDVYLQARVPGAAGFAEAVRRLRAYENAGADGLFAPGLADPAEISRLLREIRLPLNIMAFAGVPTAKELERLGVKRVSVGAGPMRATLGLVRRIAEEVLREGTYSSFLDAPSHGEVNGMFRASRP
ncbi:MAG: isocitrate lyase/PEP mutase family protein [Candidatus Binatia bacterium]